jgi:sec-independent protein translocase protein TatC
MVDPGDAIDKARKAVSQRAELPGMSLMEHLEELRRRIIHSALYLGGGFAVAWFFHDRIVDFLQRPLKNIGEKLVMTHPMDALNLDLQVALLGGAVLASPFIKKKSAWWFRSWRRRWVCFWPARPSAITGCFPEPSRS